MEKRSNSSDSKCQPRPRSFALPPNICGSGALQDPGETGGSHIRLSILLCQPNGRNDPGPVRLSADRIDHSGPRGPTAEGDRFTSGERIRRPGNSGLLQGLRLCETYATNGEDESPRVTGLHI